jgi:hypothetical protein
MSSANPTVSTFPIIERETHTHWIMARLSWGSIIAGCLVALSLHLLLTMLGIGLGFRLVNPYTDENPVLGFTSAAGIAWTISALISLWVGGWVAGRTSGKGYGNVGGLHGIVVWSVATVLSFTIFSGTIGLLAGGAAAAMGRAAAAVPALAGQTISAITPAGLKDTAASFLDEVAPTTSTTESFNVLRARREVVLVQSLIDFAGETPADAEMTVKQWEASYDQVKTDLAQLKASAELEAAVAADRVSKAMTIIAAWTFLMFGIGAFAAAWGGRCGGLRAQTHHVVVPDAELDPSV